MISTNSNAIHLFALFYPFFDYVHFLVKYLWPLHHTSLNSCQNFGFITERPVIVILAMVIYFGQMMKKNYKIRFPRWGLIILLRWGWLSRTSQAKSNHEIEHLFLSNMNLIEYQIDFVSLVFLAVIYFYWSFEYLIANIHISGYIFKSVD